MDAQSDMFSDDCQVEAVSGLSYIPNFITQEQEAELVKEIDSQSWLDDLKRRVQHYGWKYDYRARSINQDMKLGSIPPWLAGHAERLHKEGYFPTMPDQVIVNEYLPGQGITPHVDCVPCFGEAVASISLNSPCVMEFSKDNQKVPILLEPRSVVVLSGDARYQWKHSIPQRKTDAINGLRVSRERRLSLTFRTMILDKNSAQ